MLSSEESASNIYHILSKSMQHKIHYVTFVTYSQTKLGYFDTIIVIPKCALAPGTVYIKKINFPKLSYKQQQTVWSQTVGIIKSLMWKLHTDWFEETVWN